MSSFKYFVKIFLIMLIMVQAVVFSQTSASGLEEQLMLRNAMDGGSGSQMQQKGAQPSMSEMMYIQQMLGQERASGTKPLYTSNLFLETDSLLGMPLMLADTMSFVMVIDSIPIDSLHLYNDIEELRQITLDGKKRIVLRKKRVPKSVAALRRYESDFFKEANPAIFSSVTSGVGKNYPLKAGDELVLTVWGAVEKEARLQINNQGNVNVESVGIVSLNGTTLGAAEGILRTKLSKVYSGISRGQTFVNLRLETLSPVKVFLLGEVEKPGAYTFYGNTTVFQALYMAGGPNKEGSVRSVQIARADSIFNVDLYDYLMHGKNTSRGILFDGDIVFLPRAKILAGADGSVGRPAIYELKEGEGVTQLLSFAGGINPDAAEHNMVLKRIFPSGRVDFETISTPSDYISGKESLLLRNGDSLLVFKSVEVSMYNTTILGAIKYPGTYQLKDSMTATNLVEASGGLVEAGYSGRIHVLRTVPQGGYKLFSQNLDDKKSVMLEPRDTLVVYSLRDMFRPDSVSIGGAVLNPGYYQYYEGMDAKDLVLLAGGYLAESKKSSLSISRLNKSTRTGSSTEHSVPKNYDSNNNEKIRLQAWDHVEIPYDSSFYRLELVTLSGAFKNPGVYSLAHPDETLESLIRRTGGFTEEAYLDGARFFRKSLAQAEIEKDSLGISETFGLVGIDISKTLKKEKRNNISLTNGDSIHIPLKSISVRVWGEVGEVSNVLWKKGASASWYVSRAGGAKITGDESRIIIKYANGTVALVSQADLLPDPGAEVYVPFKEPPAPVVWTQVVSALGTILTAVGTLLIGAAQIYTASK
jgi:protein involved in polysaccharide export with SLBB domain